MKRAVKSLDRSSNELVDRQSRLLPLSLRIDAVKAPSCRMLIARHCHESCPSIFFLRAPSNFQISRLLAFVRDSLASLIVRQLMDNHRERQRERERKREIQLVEYQLVELDKLFQSCYLYIYFYFTKEFKKNLLKETVLL